MHFILKIFKEKTEVAFKLRPRAGVWKDGSHVWPKLNT